MYYNTQSITDFILPIHISSSHLGAYSEGGGGGAKGTGASSHQDFLPHRFSKEKTKKEEKGLRTKEKIIKEENMSIPNC